MDTQQLISKAREATALAYAPYSQLHVGAAVLLENGEIVTGANQENASYPCGICAERSALATAQNLFPSVPVLAIAIAASRDGVMTPDIITPCGMCRQVIAETEQRYGMPITIISTSATDTSIAHSIKELLPQSFR